MDKDWEKLRVWMIKKRLEGVLLRLFVHKYRWIEKCFIDGGTVIKHMIGAVWNKKPKLTKKKNLKNP